MKEAVKQETLTLIEKIVKKTAICIGAIGAFLVCLALFLLIFLSVGLFVGYVTTPNDVEKIMEKYSEKHITYVDFEIDGISATYDLNTKSINVHQTSYKQINPKTIGFNNFSKSALASLSITSSLHTLEKSFTYLGRLSRYGKNKAGKIAIVAGYAGVAVGTLCGASQGFQIGRRLKLEKLHDEILANINNPESWQKAIQYSDINITHDLDILKKYGGIGISLHFNDDNSALIISSVNQNGPAYKAGVLEGDIILKIDNSPVPDVLEEAVSKLKGQEGTSVTLLIGRGTEYIEKTIIREIINPLESYNLQEDNKTEDFENNTYWENRRISNPSALVLQPSDTSCGAFRNGIRTQVIALKYSKWDIKQEMEQETLTNLLVLDDGRLCYSDTTVYGYWTIPQNSVEMPQFIINYP